MWSLTAGVRANLSEAEWTPHAGHAVAPVVASWLGGFVNVYPRGRAVDEDDLGYDTADWWPPLPDGMVIADRKLENLALVAGRVVWVDYDQSQGDCHACRRYTAATPQFPHHGR